MPRNYKKKDKRNTYDQNILETALEALKTTKLGKVSKDLNIPLTTLRRWRDNPNIVLGSGKKTVLSKSEEDLIVTALEFTAKCGYPQGREDIKDMVQSFIKHTGRKTPFKDDRPGRDWIVLFERRHKNRLRRRKPELLTTTRAKGMSKDNIDKFFSMYENVLKEHDL